MAVESVEQEIPVAVGNHHHQIEEDDVGDHFP